MVEEVFACFETAFDYSVLARAMAERLDEAGIELRLSTKVEALEAQRDGAIVGLSDGAEINASYAFNITYAQINSVLEMAKLPKAHLKYEVAELALIEPPAELQERGITVMDGPFFSAMPYPSAGLYSLTHVRYTPHESWSDGAGIRDPYQHFASRHYETRYAFMLRDAQRYLPCLSASKYNRSIYDVKTVLVKNEQDDGRPILYQQSPNGGRVISILGGKIDNIYDLFEAVKSTAPEFSKLHPGFVLGAQYV